MDFSNYSSWHYRSTLLKLNKENLDSELTLVQNAVFTDPSDSSAWYYLRFVISNADMTKEQRENLIEALDQLLELEPDCKCKFFLFYLFIYFSVLISFNTSYTHSEGYIGTICNRKTFCKHCV